MTTLYPKIVVKDGRISRHPWVFNSSLAKPSGEVKNGSIVDIIDPKGGFLARGHYNKHARIGVRILTRDPGTIIDKSFFKEHLKAALTLRSRVYPESQEPQTAFRVVHGEADFLSGVVIDVFAQNVIAQFTSAGMFYQRDMLFEALKELIDYKHLYYFADKHVQKQESFNCRTPAEAFQAEISEYGAKFIIDPSIEHKTGFFLDQRENRMALCDYTKGKRVLDLCCFSGGFAISAKLNGQASYVKAIDMDPEVIALAKKNAELNGVEIDFETANIHEWLKQDFAYENQFDVVILDPAKLTKSREKIPSALYQYTEMNKMAVRALRPGGIFLSCSCTGLVSESDFLNCVRKGTGLANRSLQILKITGASADHPVLADAPETRYLKAIWGVVSN